MELKKLGWGLFFKKYFSGGHLQVMNSSPQPQMIQMINQPANGITYQGQEQAIIQESGQPIYIETQAQNQQVLKRVPVDTLNWLSMKNVFFTP